MHRRFFLSGSAVSLASLSGCLRRLGSVGSSLRTVSELGIRRQPTELNLELSVSIRDRAMTLPHTAKIAFELANTGDTERIIPFYGNEWDGLHSIDESYSPEGGLMLVPVEQDLQSSGPGCWRIHESNTYPGGPGSGPSYNLGPGESFMHEFGIWIEPGRTECLPSGDFLFGQQLTDDGNGDGGAWKFSLKFSGDKTNE